MARVERIKAEVNYRDSGMTADKPADHCGNCGWCTVQAARSRCKAHDMPVSCFKVCDDWKEEK